MHDNIFHVCSFLLQVVYIKNDPFVNEVPREDDHQRKQTNLVLKQTDTHTPNLLHFPGHGFFPLVVFVILLALQ